MTSEIIKDLINANRNPLIKVPDYNGNLGYPHKYIGTSDEEWVAIANRLVTPEMAAEAKAAAKKGGRHSRRHPRRHRGPRGGSSRMRSRGKRTSKKRNMRH
jgi:hypothetical protein